MADLLKFETETEKTAALEEIQNKVGGASVDDLEEIDRISSTEVNKKDDGEESTEQENNVKPGEGEGSDRNWEITEELISEYDDEYFDGQKNRKFITQKNPGDLLKSYVNVQKNNHYMKTQRIPQAKDEGYNQARSEYEDKMKALQVEIDGLKSKDVEIKPAEKKTGALQKEYNEAMERLSGISDEDSIEHTAAIKNALLLSQKLREEDSSRGVEDITEEYNKKFIDFEKKFEEKEQNRLHDLELKNSQKEQKATLEGIYSEIDAFARSKDAPKEAVSNQNFKDMLSDAMEFHNSLAEVYTGKTSTSYDQKDWNGIMEKVGTMYLNKLPELITRAKETGINEPKNYNQWQFLDNLDAIRTGMMRNPETNEWTNRYDKNTGKPVNLGDIKTAYNYYLDESGLREKNLLSEKKADAENLMGAINKRDGAMIQLDDSKISKDGDGQVLTQKEATEYLEKIDMDYIRAEEMRGNLEPLKKANAALVRLEAEPLQVMLET